MISFGILALLFQSALFNASVNAIGAEKTAAIHGHETGHKVPKKFSIPKKFTLGPNQTLQCTTCHSSSTGTKKNPKLRETNSASEMCKACHANKTGGMEKGNHMMDELTVENDKLRKGPTGQVICQTCHRAHGSEENKSLLAFDDVTDLCLQCHTTKDKRDLVDDKIQLHPVHRPDASLGCTLCHSPHSKMEKPEKPGDYCQQCHADENHDAATLGKHNLTVSDPKRKNVDGQTPDQSGVCGACHTGHVFAQKPGPGQDLVSKMCFACHKVWKDTDGAGTPHLIHANKPISQKRAEQSGLPTPGGVVSCVTCHDPHQGKSSHFLRVSVGKNSQLCKKCHTAPDKQKDKAKN